MDNVNTDAVPCLPQFTDPFVETDLKQAELDHSKDIISLEFDNNTLLECYLYHPILPGYVFPLNIHY